MTDESAAESSPPSGRRSIPMWRQRRYQMIGAGIALALVAVVALALALFAGGDDDPVTASSTRPSSSSTSEGPTTTTQYAGPFAPLTGVPDRTGATQGRAAMTVKIDNTNISGAKRGIDQADIVYEEVVEGGLTRLAAIFQSRVPTDIGPIRSVRLTDQAIVRPIGGLFVYSGGARYAENSIETAPVIRINESAAGDAMWRDGSRKKPHNLFGRAKQLFAFGGDPKPPPPLFEYRRRGRAPAGIPITTAHIGFEAGFDVTWTWDRASHRWHRTFLGEQEFVDGGAPIAPANIVVQFVDYVGGGTPEAQLAGEGTVWVLTEGRAIQGTWSRPDASQPGHLLDANGESILLTPGQTWVELPENGYEFSVG
jgi:hypothetical protein